jgi:predicted lipoprotein
MTVTGTTSAKGSARSRRPIYATVAVLGLVGLIALDTTVVQVGSDGDLRQQVFDPDRFGQDEFPRIRDIVTERAPEASALAAALAEDKAAAVADYGTMAGAFPVLPVTLTGVMGDGSSGIFGVTVEGMPEGTTLRVQTGPAINGTELRDIPGDIAFGAFTNQIEYQDAGAGINRAMAEAVLADLDRDALTGKTVTVTGAFTLINQANWLITPVALEVQP